MMKEGLNKKDSLCINCVFIGCDDIDIILK